MNSVCTIRVSNNLLVMDQYLIIDMINAVVNKTTFILCVLSFDLL